MNDREIKGFGEPLAEKSENIEGSHEKIYKGSLVNLLKGSNVFYGVAEGIYHDKKVGEFGIQLNPHITFNPDDTYSVKDDLPMRVGFPIDGIRPANGTLEQWVEKFNRDIQREKREI